MKTDKELLELAAKAAGYNIKAHEDGTLYSDYRCPGYWGVFNPLNDDGDALRLAVDLRFVVTVGSKNVEVRRWTGADDEPIGLFCRTESQGNNPMSATRRAIVRAAAAIGESK